MKRTVIPQWAGPWAGMIVAMGWLGGLATGLAALVPGDLAPDFLRNDRATGEIVSLHSNYVSYIVVLEFFNAANPECRQAAPVVKRDVRDYYAALQLPVKVLYLNGASPAQDAQTDRFIREFGLARVVDDVNGLLLAEYGGTAVPHFVVVHGRAGSLSHLQWEILHGESGFVPNETVARLRAAIETVRPPSVVFTSPAEGAQVTNGLVTIRGTTVDSAPITNLMFRLENAAGVGEYQEAATTNDWRDWTAPVSNLYAGTNRVRVVARNERGNFRQAARSFFYHTEARLKWSVAGPGTIAPVLTNQSLVVGQGYTATATPGGGYILSNWVAVSSADPVPRAVGTRPTLNFLMQTGLCLQAQFVPNPFPRLQGTYSGMFFDRTNGVHPETSGFFSLALTGGGSYSGYFGHDGQRIPFSGHFDLNGRATNVADCGCGVPIYAEWNLELGQNYQEQITADVEHHGFPLWAIGDRAPVYGTRACPFQGNYTFILPGDPAGAGRPSGDSYGVVTVDRGGMLTFAGKLADGSSLSQSVPLSTNGVWPMHAMLYSGQGTLLGWPQFARQPRRLAGEGIVWLRPAMVTGYFSNGFILETNLVGSFYPGSNPTLPVSNACVALVEPDQGVAFRNRVILTAANAVVNLGPQPLTMSITTSNGLFRGNVAIPCGLEGPCSLAPVVFQGVVLPARTNGAGYFRLNGRSGRVEFGPCP